MEKLIDGTIASAVEARAQLTQDCNDYAQSLAELEQLEAEFASLSADYAAQTAAIGTDLTRPALQAANAALELKLAGAEATRGKLDATARGLEGQVTGMQRELEAVTQSNCMTRGVFCVWDCVRTSCVCVCCFESSVSFLAPYIFCL